MSRPSLLRLLLAASLAVLLAPAPAGASVIASGGLKYVTKNYTPTPDVVKPLAAPCPKATHVWGGGHYNSGTFSQALPRHSFPYDDGDRGRAPDDGWKVQFSADQGVLVPIYAVCADPRPRYEQGSVTAAPQAQTQGQVGCDEAFEAVSGGTKGNQNLIETKSGPGLGFDWFFALDNYAVNPHPIKTFAVCVRREVSVPSSNDQVLPRSQEGHSVSCPAGRRIVGGGVGNIGQFQDIAIAASRPVGFGSTGADGWQVYLDNFDNSTTYAFSVFATCVASLR